MRADRPNDTASTPSARYGSITATTAAPATNQDLARLIADVADRRAEHELIPGQQGGAGGGEWRAGQHGAEQQHAQRGERHAGYRHQPDRDYVEQLAGDHDAAAREQAREPGQQRPARDRRQVGQRGKDAEWVR
jgi:hypothetical protein